jgi:hypothetical protein
MKVIRLKDLMTPGQGIDTTIASMVRTSFTIQYFFHSNSHSLVGKIVFEHTVAFRFSNEGHTSIYPRESSETLAECIDSEWITELKAYPDAKRWPFQCRHFMLFLKNKGFFEVVAENFSLEIPIISN